MPDVTAVLASRQEREKWRQRVTLLETSLRELRAQRLRLERRLSSLKRELAHLTLVTRAARAASQPIAVREVLDGRRPPSIR